MCTNEADVIRETLVDAAQYCDEIYVYDLGSTDGTVEIVKELEDDVIHLFDSVRLPFHDGRNADVWRSLWAERPGDFTEEDWYWVMDADEQLAADPMPTLTCSPYRLLGVNIHLVQMITFALTPDDISRWRAGDHRPVRERLTSVLLAAKWWKQEPRFFRCGPAPVWSPDPSPEQKGIQMGHKIPQSCRLTGWRDIPMLHYPYRNPEQVQQRTATRRSNRAGGGRFAPQWGEEAVASQMSQLGPTALWKPGQPLPGGRIRRYRRAVRTWVATVVKRCTNWRSGR